MTEPAFHGLRVLLLEDDRLDAELIVRMLQQIDPGCEVEVVNDEEGFRRALDAFSPNVVLSDHAVPHFKAADALALVRRQRPQCPVLMVAGAFEPGAVACLRAGAADFIHKSELSRLPAAIVAALDLRAPLRKLSDRQLEVLRLLAEGSSTKEIAERLALSVKTVETHRAEAMKRLSLRDLASIVRYAIRVGIVSASDE